MPRYAPDEITEIFRVKVTSTYVGPAGHPVAEGRVSVGYYGPYTSLSAANGMATRMTFRSYLFDDVAEVQRGRRCGVGDSAVMKYGKTEIKKIVDILNEEVVEFETVDEAAIAVLKAAEEIFASRAKFVVVGQLASSPERSVISPNDDDAIRVSLGWYSTEGDAIAAARSMWSSLASGETFRTWVLPVHHGTPADFHKARKGHYEALELKARERRREDIRKSIERLKNVKPDEGVMGT